MGLLILKEIIMHDFTNCTFLIPYRKTHLKDRENNLIEVLKYLDTFLKTNILLVEQTTDNVTSTEFLINHLYFKNLKISYKNYKSSGCFHKTKLYNIGLSLINTDIVIPYDIDILIPIEQLIKSRNLLMNGYDYCFPFNNQYVEISKKLLEERKKLLNDYNFDYYLNIVKTYTNTLTKNIKDGPPGLLRNCPPGGCLFIKRNTYIDMGMENEDFCGYGPEDSERKFRLKVLEYKQGIVEGYLYHIEHEIEGNRISSQNNKSIFNSLQKMNKEKIKNYYLNKKYKEHYNIK